MPWLFKNQFLTEHLHKKDIELKVTDDTIEVRAKKEEEKEDKSEKYMRRERVYSEFYRSFRLPGTIDSESVDAKFDKGTLTVTLPKKEVEKSKKIEVK